MSGHRLTGRGRVAARRIARVALLVAGLGVFAAAASSASAADAHVVGAPGGRHVPGPVAAAGPVPIGDRVRRRRRQRPRDRLGPGDWEGESPGRRSPRVRCRWRWPAPRQPNARRSRPRIRRTRSTRPRRRHRSPVVLEPTSTSPNDEPPTTDGLACPSTSSCVAADTQGNVITFDPGSSAAPVVTSLGQELVVGGGVSVGDRVHRGRRAASRRRSTRRPRPGRRRSRSSRAPTGSSISPVHRRRSARRSMAPVARSRSTRRRRRRRRPAEWPIGGSSAAAIACGAIDPMHGRGAERQGVHVRSVDAGPTGRRARKIDTSGIGGGPGQTEGLTAINCPATTSCVAVDAVGRAIAFAPASPGTPKPVRIDGGSPLLGVSCPSTRQCTAMGPYIESTFNPLSGKAADARDDRHRPLLPGERRRLRHHDPVPVDHHRSSGDVRSQAVQAAQDASARVLHRRGDHRDRLPDRERMRRGRQRRLRDQL